MDILVLTREYPPYVLGGISYHLKYLYNTLSERGHSITVIAGRCGDADYLPSIEIDDNIRIIWAWYPKRSANFIQYPLAAKKALKEIDVSNFDIAVKHTEYPFTLDIPVISKKHDCKPESLKYMRQDLPNYAKILDYTINPLRRLIDSRSVKTADFIIYNSKLTRRLWEEYLDVSNNSTVIYNGVDTETFYPRNSGLDRKYFLFVGDSERKGLSKIKSFSPHSSAPVYIVGPRSSSIHNTKALGRLSQDELAQYYSGALATIHPARFEAFGNIILESLACGTPVITSKNCGASELIDSSCGIVTDEISEGTNQIDQLTKEDCVMKAEKYTWDRVASRTEEALEKVL